MVWQGLLDIDLVFFAFVSINDMCIICVYIYICIYWDAMYTGTKFKQTDFSYIFI